MKSVAMLGDSRSPRLTRPFLGAGKKGCALFFFFFWTFRRCCPAFTPLPAACSAQFNFRFVPLPFRTTRSHSAAAPAPHGRLLCYPAPAATPLAATLLQQPLCSTCNRAARPTCQPATLRTSSHSAAPALRCSTIPSQQAQMQSLCNNRSLLQPLQTLHRQTVCIRGHSSHGRYSAVTLQLRRAVQPLPFCSSAPTPAALLQLR